MRLLVAGFGNELIPGDACAKSIVEQIRLPCGEARWLGRGVQALIHLIHDYDALIVVDASRRVPRGTVRTTIVESCDQLELNALHEAGLLEALCMAMEVSKAVTGRHPLVYLVECGIGSPFDGEAASLAIREAIPLIEELAGELCARAESGQRAGQEARGDG